MAFLDMDLSEQVRNHKLYKIQQTVDLSSLVYRLKDLEHGDGRHGYGLDVGLKSLFLQFFYELSDRELEDRLRYDLGFKWFCGFIYSFHFNKIKTKNTLIIRSLK